MATLSPENREPREAPLCYDLSEKQGTHRPEDIREGYWMENGDLRRLSPISAHRSEEEWLSHIFRLSLTDIP